MNPWSDDELQRSITAARLDGKSAEAVRALAKDPAVRPVAEDFLRRVDASPKEAVAALKVSDVCHLLLALLEVPAARARHAADGVPPDISAATFVDLGVWARHTRKRERRLGVPLEILDWAQAYLRGRLYRFGSVQLAVVPFPGPFHCLKLADGRQVLLAPADLETTHDGRHLPKRAPAAPLPEVWTAREVDPREGRVTDRIHHVRVSECERVLSPGDPMLEMHIPADAHVTIAGFASAVRDGLKFFRAEKPRGVFGEAWLLDPQVLALIPGHAELQALQELTWLYPGAIPEAKTVRRLFGPSATRAALPREGLNALQTATAALLSDPSRHLCARGGFVIGPALERLVGPLP